MVLSRISIRNFFTNSLIYYLCFWDGGMSARRLICHALNGWKRWQKVLRKQMLIAS